MVMYKRLSTSMKKSLLLLGLFVFYTYGFLWSLKPRKVSSAEDVLKLFYYGFLRLRSEDVEVVKLSDRGLITISRNPCPILKLALLLKMDTRYVCRLISETVCKYVLKRMNPKLVFERNYDHIRPYANGCMEKVYFPS